MKTTISSSRSNSCVHHQMFQFFDNPQSPSELNSTRDSRGLAVLLHFGLRATDYIVYFNRTVPSGSTDDIICPFSLATHFVLKCFLGQLPPPTALRKLLYLTNFSISDSSGISWLVIMMNMFRLAGDMCHVASIVVLILHLRVSKNAIGVSLKTQELHLIVFVTRYLDLFTTFISNYNSTMKILYISATAYIIYTIRGKEPYKSNFDETGDSFLHYRFAVAPCVVLAVLTKCIEDFSTTEVKFLWALICG